jgi:kynurenine formamidase
MGRTRPADYANSWSAPGYSVDDDGKIVGGYTPREPNNWGRWGEDDQRGTQNLIGPEERIAAAQLVKTGKIFSLALPLRHDAPVWPPRPAPQRLATMTGSDAVVGSPANAPAPGFQWSDDILTVSTHGSTHWDGLAHGMCEDSLYNGWWAGNVTAVAGSRVLGIEQQRDCFVGRGVLADVARHQGVEACPARQVITPQMLDDTLATEGVELQSGDILLVHTGHLARWWTRPKDQAPMTYFLDSPGISRDNIPWLHEHGISALACDTIGVEPLIPEDSEDRGLPLHSACLVDLGLTLGELWVLDDLAADCAADGTYEFMLAAQPLNLPGGMGSPLNPIALK